VHSSRSLGLQYTANKVIGQRCLVLCKAISHLLIEVDLNDGPLCDVNASRPIVLLQLYRVVRFFHPRSSCTTTHISADVQRITLNASCMTVSGGRTKQLDIFCRITGFTSDFLSFVVVELIRFLHGALQLVTFALSCFIRVHNQKEFQISEST